MKYCTQCYKLIPDGENCACGVNLEECKAQSSVMVTSVKGHMRVVVESALKEKGIPCEFFNPESNVYNQLNVKVNAETDYSLLVPFEFYSEAFDICIGLGMAAPENKAEIDSATQVAVDGKTYDEKFTEVTGVKPKAFKVFWIVLFIVVACLLIWGVDLIAALIKNSLGIPVTAKLLSFFNFLP